MIELDSEYENCELKGVYTMDGIKFDNASKVGNYLLLNSESIPVKSTYLTVVLQESLEKNIESVRVSRVGFGFYKLEDLTVNRTGIDGLYYTAPCDILDIESITDAAGLVYEAREYRLNSFYIKPHKEIHTDENGVNTEVEIPITEPITVQNVKYIEPFTFVLLSQNLSQADAQDVVESKGDGVVSFPYACNVAQNDILTALAGTYTNKETANRMAKDTDTLSAYFVDSVVKLYGKNREYEQGVDFILIGTNQIKWICEDAPASGETYSITYNVFPTYIVLKSIPQIRTSENQRIPKKAVVKLASSYSEMTNLNRQ